MSHREGHQPIKGREESHTPGLCWLRQGASKNLGLEQLRRPCRVRMKCKTFRLNEFHSSGVMFQVRLMFICLESQEFMARRRQNTQARDPPWL